MLRRVGEWVSASESERVGKCFGEWEQGLTSSSLSGRVGKCFGEWVCGKYCAD